MAKYIQYFNCKEKELVLSVGRDGHQTFAMSTLIRFSFKMHHICYIYAGVRTSPEILNPLFGNAAGPIFV